MFTACTEGMVEGSLGSTPVTLIELETGTLISPMTKCPRKAPFKSKL